MIALSYSAAFLNELVEETKKDEAFLKECFL